MKAVIIEDLKVAADYLDRCCSKSGQIEVLGHFPDVAKALEFLNENTVDLLFLDVEMPGASGFDLLDNLAYRPKVILTTSKEEYAYNAFEYKVEDFLKKPFSYQRFMDALQKINAYNQREEDEASSSYMFIKTEHKLVRLNFDDILYIQSMGDYVRFVTADKKYITANSIRNLQEKLPGRQFIRSHRSYIINIQKIQDIRENDLFINGVEIPISKNNRAEILKRLTII